MTGKQLYEVFHLYYSANTGMAAGRWEQAAPAVAMAFEELALCINEEIYKMMQDPEYVPGISAGHERDWKAIAQKYGRHSLRCSTGSECVCGFAEIEKALQR